MWDVALTTSHMSKLKAVQQHWAILGNNISRSKPERIATKLIEQLKWTSLYYCRLPRRVLLFLTMHPNYKTHNKHRRLPLSFSMDHLKGQHQYSISHGNNKKTPASSTMAIVTPWRSFSTHSKQQRLLVPCDKLERQSLHFFAK